MCEGIQLDAMHKEQLEKEQSERKEEMQQMMLQMREILAKFSTHMHSSRLPQVPKKFNLTKLNLLQCIVM